MLKFILTGTVISRFCTYSNETHISDDIGDILQHKEVKVHFCCENNKIIQSTEWDLSQSCSSFLLQASLFLLLYSVADLEANLTS